MQRRMTPVSVIAWWPMWFKYHVVPGFVRFLWWVLVWVPLSAVYREVHRYTVKLGKLLLILLQPVFFASGRLFDVVSS
jgi:hypothetical protein